MRFDRKNCILNLTVASINPEIPANSVGKLLKLCGEGIILAQWHLWNFPTFLGQLLSATPGNYAFHFQNYILAKTHTGAFILWWIVVLKSSAGNFRTYFKVLSKCKFYHSSSLESVKLWTWRTVKVDRYSNSIFKKRKLVQQLGIIKYT